MCGLEWFFEYRLIKCFSMIHHKEDKCLYINSSFNHKPLSRTILANAIAILIMLEWMPTTYSKTCSYFRYSGNFLSKLSMYNYSVHGKSLLITTDHFISLLIKNYLRNEAQLSSFFNQAMPLWFQVFIHGAQIVLQVMLDWTLTLSVA